MSIQEIGKKFATKVSPVLGAGAVGACPLCWVGSASLLTYLGLGALVTAWIWLVLGFIIIGVIGFVLDFRSHRNIRPLLLLIAGSVLLYVGRYVFVAKDLGYWPIWGTGAILIVVAIVLNRKEFRKHTSNTES